VDYCFYSLWVFLIQKVRGMCGKILVGCVCFVAGKYLCQNRESWGDVKRVICGNGSIFVFPGRVFSLMVFGTPSSDAVCVYVFLKGKSLEFLP